MSLREDLRAACIAEEGVRLKPYKDTVGKLTIGIGRNLDDVGITEAEALVMLDADLDQVEKALDHGWPWWRSLKGPAQLALMQMCFQLGAGKLAAFKAMWAALERRDYASAKNEALDSAWATQTPARAQRVAALFTTEV